MRIFGILLVVFCACKPASKTLSQDETALQKLVSRELGENATVSINDSKSFALGVKKKDESVRYMVVRLSDNKVVLTNNMRGTISWSGDMQLAESHTPGIIKKDSKQGDNSRTIDLKQFIIQNK